MPVLLFVPADIFYDRREDIGCRREAERDRNSLSLGLENDVPPVNVRLWIVRAAAAASDSLFISPTLQLSTKLVNIHGGQNKRGASVGGFLHARFAVEFVGLCRCGRNKREREEQRCETTWSRHTIQS